MLGLLWRYREGISWEPQGGSADGIAHTKERLFELMRRLEGEATTPATDAIVAFVRDELWKS
jgi:hypothetical protein